MEKIQCTWVIDDDPIDNITFKKLSEHAEFSEEVTGFISAVDALDRYQKLIDENSTLPSVIFLDIRMPIVSGWDFIDRYSSLPEKHTRQTAVYMLTSSVDQSDIHRAKSHPLIVDYIVKPITIDKLAEIKVSHLPQAAD